MNKINTQQTNFWFFLKNNTIEIPIIQRDYAQGRKGKEDLRKSFLENLYNALIKGNELKLDFIYGIIEDNKLNPLDGQQRLTTLWLFYWYVALNARALKDERTREIFKHFTYQTRVSSRDFCKCLCDNYKSISDNLRGDRISSIIAKQKWFYSYWEQDPTIQAMLRMLGGSFNPDKNNIDQIDGIEEQFAKFNHALRFKRYYDKKHNSLNTLKFGKRLKPYKEKGNIKPIQEVFSLKSTRQSIIEIKYKKLWKKLTSNECPIVFYYLNLPDFELTDDLYIKMNSRGKQLTNFENFKADFIDFIKKEIKEARYLDPITGFPIKLDTIWTDIFWQNQRYGNIDEIYYAFIKRFCLNELIRNDHKVDESNVYYKFFSNELLQYESGSFKNFKELFQNKDILKSLYVILNNLSEFYDRQDKNNEFQYEWDNTFFFIPKYEDDINRPPQAEDESLKISSNNPLQRVVFYGFCKYFKDGKYDSVSFERWKRFIWNLVSDKAADSKDLIRSVSSIRSAITLIDKIYNSHDVYNELCRQTINGDSALNRRFLEEIDKAIQISWGRILGATQSEREIKIIKMEKHAFFNGAIRFLFHDEQNNIDWKGYERRCKNAKDYFDNSGVTFKYKQNATLLRSFLSRINDIPDSMWFGNDKDFWHNILLNSDYQKPVSILLSGNTAIEGQKDWILSDLLSILITDDNDSWHVIHGWRGYDVLTTYSKQFTGHLNRPKDIVVLNHQRNELLKNMDSPDRIADLDYFYGWNVLFSFRGFTFQWYGERSVTDLDVYLVNKNNDYLRHNMSNPNKTGTDKDDYYCFRVSDDESFSSIKLKLIHTIHSAVCRYSSPFPTFYQS
jgi:hypothetical protein